MNFKYQIWPVYNVLYPWLNSACLHLIFVKFPTHENIIQIYFFCLCGSSCLFNSYPVKHIMKEIQYHNKEPERQMAPADNLKKIIDK